MPRATTQPKPITIKRPTIDLAGLELAYGWMTYNRNTGLEMATDWYGANAPYLLVGQPLTPDQQKTYQRASKAAELGKQEVTPEAVEHALTTSIRLYEKIWTETTRMGAAPSNSNATAVKTVVDNFNTTFGKFNVQYQPTTTEEREFSDQPKFNGMESHTAYNVRVPFKELLDLAGKSPLESALAEAPAVTQMLSVATRLELDEKTGMYNKVAELDGAKFMENLPNVLHAVYEFVAGSNSKLTQPVGRIRQTATIKGTASITRTKKWADSDVINVLKPSHPFTGELGRKVDLIKDGMTVAEFKRARRKAGLGSGCYPIETAVKKGYVKVG